jgi:hypothetical protein
MRTLTDQEMFFVAGGAQKGDELPKKKDDAGPSGVQVATAAARCAAAVAVTRRAPTYSNAMMAAYQCSQALQMAGQYLTSRAGRKG